ncbi:MAG: phage virion morphogenesis protein [Candidatus Gastranaerophilales bacterium]|nr:phage virion morphogenesis protein [Candidatus Gastranaerophilales bacterium]
MSDKPIEIKIDNKEVESKLLNLAEKSENLRPLMKNIAGIFASSTEENFKEEGRPDKWIELSEITIKKRKEIDKWPGQILQVEGLLASSINTYYDNVSAIIGSNQPYAAIHQLGGQAGKSKKVTIPARPYLHLTDDDFEEILNAAEEFLSNSDLLEN